MAKTKKQKKIAFYKRAEFSPKGATLQQYLGKAIKRAPKPIDRVENLDKEGTVKRFINSSRSKYGMLFGQMMRYEPGKDQVIFVLDEGSQEYPVETIGIPQNDDGKAREFLESVLYFGVLEDHMLVLQSQALKARDLEGYLSWLFHLTKVLPKETIFLLSDQPTKEAREKIEKSHVRKVNIGAPLSTSVERTEHTGEKGSPSKGLKYFPIGRGFDILSAALGPEWRQRLKLKDALDEANLRVNLEVTYFRKTTKSAHDVLDNIATSLRHMEPDDVRVDLEGGGFLKGDDLKFSGKLDVFTLNGIIDADNLYKEMAAWLKHKIEEGKVA